MRHLERWSGASGASGANRVSRLRHLIYPPFRGGTKWRGGAPHNEGGAKN